MAKRRRKFARMTCPVKGCTHMDGQPQTGTVPGVKRHVLAIHGRTAYNKIKWDRDYPLYPVSGLRAGIRKGSGKSRTKAAATA